MKTVKTVKTVEKVITVCSWLILMLFLINTAPVLAADTGPDDTPNYGTRAIRITHPCDPEIPPPLSAGSCTTVTPGSWSFDISWFDPATQKYYLADRSNFAVDIVDTKTDKVAGEATGFVGIQPGSNTSGPNGVLVTHHPHQLWAGDGDGVQVFSLDGNGLPIAHIKTIPNSDPKLNASHRADELSYDPDDQLILQAWDDDSDLFVAFISVSSNPSDIKVLGTISFKSSCPTGGCSTDGIEQGVYDHKLNRFLLAVPATTGHTNGEIAVINPHTMLVETVYGQLDGTGCFPHGLALGPHQNLLLGCSADGPAGTQLVSIIMDARNGNILKTFDQVGGSDEVWYNEGDNTYYLAASNWTKDGCTPPSTPGGCVGGTPLPVLGIIDAGSDKDGPEFIQNIKTGPSSHSVAAVYAVRCDRNDPDRDDGGPSNCNRNGRGRDFIRNRAYVPLRINSTTGETGGIRVDGRIP